MSSEPIDNRPLADRMRPRSLDDLVGQPQLLGAGKPLSAAIRNDNLHSMILWGPPGSGKTTLARLIAEDTRAVFAPVSAVLAGIKDIRKAVDDARATRSQTGRTTVLFVDEVHRFNKTQQDAFLPHVEDGTVVFVGATTENPSFEVNNALLSRLRVYVLRPLTVAALRHIIDRAVDDTDCGLGHLRLQLEPDLRDQIADAADGDARRALNLLELAAELAEVDGDRRIVSAKIIAEVFTRGPRRFDKGGDAFYDQISALHKSVRGSAPDAALYWFARMLDGGCDPLYIARRVVRMASEDIGNADPRALRLALDAWETYERLGSPEGELAIAQAIVYLASTAKSNAVYRAFNEVRTEVRQQGSLPVPDHLRNAPTGLARKLGHGKAYRYAHDEPEGYAAGENYFPDDMTPRRYYRPVARGLEQKIRDKLERLRQLDRARDDADS